MLAFRAPRATDARAPALAALAVTLAGTSSGSDGASGRSSRLHRALVEKGLAANVDASFRLTKDPHLFWIEAMLRPETAHLDAERVLLAELEKVAKDEIGDAEFARVKRQLLAATAFGTDTITWRAYRCGEILSTGAATSLAEWYEKLASVTREQIREAAAATFTESVRNVGWFIPEAAD
jgi:zinc protease